MNLNINNCIAILTDNARVMVGINNCVFAMLKQENASLFLMRCVRRAIHVAMSFASDEC